jgi:hypothetical protein
MIGVAIKGHGGSCKLEELIMKNNYKQFSPQIIKNTLISQIEQRI